MTDKLLTTKEHTEAHGDKIKGYRQLNDMEIALINDCKAIGLELEDLFQRIADAPEVFLDQRWHSDAKTDMQTGMMKLIRSIARPEGF